MAIAGLVVCALGVLSGEAVRSRRKMDAWKLPAQPLDSITGGADGLWARDKEQAYFAPDAGSRLSKNISDYYYAHGPLSTLTEEHARSRVGGKGMVHIFHLPKGTASLDQASQEVSIKKKVAGLSELRQLTQGAELASFPEHPLPGNYVDPLDSNGLAVERSIMGAMTEASYLSYMEELTDPNSRNLRTSSRNTDDKDATVKVVDFLQSQFKSLGMDTCVLNFKHRTWRGEKDIYNVIGMVRGTSSGSVTIGGHFDDLPSRGSAPGAEDDGSGTAAVLAAAKAFVGAGASPKKTMYFLAFGGEEQGLIGSARFAQELKNPGSSDSPIPEGCRVSASSDHTAFTMDMIGYRNPSFAADTVLIETYDQYQSLLNSLAMSNKVNNGGALKVTFSNNPFGSDHMSFLRNGLPATLSIDNDGDVYQYPCYHKSCDSMQYINTRFANDIAKMNLGAALRVAGLN